MPLRISIVFLILGLSAEPGTMDGRRTKDGPGTKDQGPGTTLFYAQTAVMSVQETLIQLERDWDQAFLRKDVPFIENILADDFTTTYPDGSRGDKKRELQLLAELDQQIDSSTLDEFTVKVNGDTALVWFRRRLVGPVQGKPTEITFRFLDVFVWRDDRWQCLASHSTRVTAPE